VDSQLSDSAEPRFGIRTVTSQVNRHNETVFTLNVHPFQDLRGGYSPDHFFRWDRNRFIAIANYIFDTGQNTLRLEGTLEHPELYEIADEMEIMVIAGWVCCSKWESWDFNHDLDFDPPPLWDEGD
jgi:exo-1,4-beta-D-glucosaminidase